MYIDRLFLRNYRMFEDICIDLNPDYSVIVGVNGAGKTTVLDALAIAASTMIYKISGAPKLSIKNKDARREYYSIAASIDVQPQYPIGIAAFGKVATEEISWMRTLNSEGGKTTIGQAKQLLEISEEYQERIKNGDNTLVLPIFAYYGTARLVDTHKQRTLIKSKNNSRTNGYNGCFDGAPNISVMMDWFRKKTIQRYQGYEKGLSDSIDLDVVYKAIRLCLASFTKHGDAKVEYNFDTNELDIYYFDNNGKRIRNPLSIMSDGFKEIISITADIAYRMAVLNPQLEDNILNKTEGIVLIDEIDLHLHPAWQQHVMEALISTFPKVQFIVTTHAPAVINSVKSENLIILENEKAREANSQIYGKDVNSVLKEIMGVDERPSYIADMFDDFYDKLDKKNLDEAEKILDHIAKIRDYHDPELASCRIKLKMARFRSEK